MLLTIREPVRGCLDAGDAIAKPSFGESMHFLWAHKAAVHVIMGAGVAA